MKPQDHPEGYPLSEEECEEIGGHCYDRSPVVKTSDPPVHTRICRHCGHTQKGRKQPSVNWHDT